MNTTEALKELREVINRLDTIDEKPNDVIFLKVLFNIFDKEIIENKNNLPNDWK